MNRRTKDRLDLQLLCRVGAEKVLSKPSGATCSLGLTENLSRSGLLIRWLDAVALPEVGTDLTVDIDLPVDASFGPRVMRCQATVVRIIRPIGVLPTVGMKIGNIRVIPAQQAQAHASVVDTSTWALELMPPANTRPI
jgi:hypothetical protein